MTNREVVEKLAKLVRTNPSTYDQRLAKHKDA